MNVSTGTGYTAPLFPAANWDNSVSHSHTVQFYEDDAFLLGDLSRFIGSALGAGDVGVVFATKAHRESLAERLGSRGLNVALAVRRGRYISLDASDTLSSFMVDGRPNSERFDAVISGVFARAEASVKGGKTGVVAFGEMVALLWADGKLDAAIQLEQLWNDMVKSHSIELHCAYPIRLFGRSGDGASIERIFAVHSHVTPAESYTALSTEEDRLRAITFLQQKAEALETEIEARKRAQRSLARRNHELHNAVVARDEFLSVAAHELKTPITSLRGFAQLLLRNIERRQAIPEERLGSALKVIEEQTGKLNHLILRLLDCAQIEAGKLQVEPFSVDLVGLVRSVLAQQQLGANHRVVFDGPERLEAKVDPVRFEQVITNLVDNAIKFSPEESIVKVSLERGAGAGGNVRLSVTDHGIGVPCEQREAIFDRFHQAHNDHYLSGLGLGLYISREIVQLHGGSIRIEEPEHPGSRFVVTLPRGRRRRTRVATGRGSLA
jgi:signal transduction histidine kinase